jgi:hypothetical protein
MFSKRRFRGRERELKNKASMNQNKLKDIS